MNLAALRSSLENQINQIVSMADSELTATDVGQLINRETQYAINRLALLQDLPLFDADGIGAEKADAYRTAYRNMLDHLLSHNTDAFVVVKMLEDLRIHQAVDKITIEACMSDLARRCDAVYKTAWTIIKEIFGYGEPKWVDVWHDLCTDAKIMKIDRTVCNT